MKKLFAFLAVLILALCACQPSGEDIELARDDASDSPLLYNYERQTARVAFTCNRTWKASSPDEWIELDASKGSAGEGQKLKFYLTENPSYEYRTGSITITAGSSVLELQVIQEPKIVYLLQENFKTDELLLESNLPYGWNSIDADDDGYGWRCWLDPESEQSFAYSASYYDIAYKMLSPDNYMVSPQFTIPGKGFSVKWDARGSDPEFLGDKYEVYTAAIVDNKVNLHRVICEETIASATEFSHHDINLDGYEGLKICIVFRHFDSTDLARVLITNVEVSNRKY